MPRIEIGEVRYFVEQFLRESKRLRDALRDYRKAVAKLVADGEIKGEFVDSAKSYYETVHYPIIDTTIECLSEADRILKKYVQDFESQVDDAFDSRLDSDKLDALYAEIRRSENLLDDFTHAMDSMTGNLNLGQQIGMKLGLETSMMQIKEEIKVLERYLDFEHSHTNVMHDVLSRMYQVKTGVNEIMAGKAFNATTHTYDSNKMQLGWLNHLVPEKKPKKTYNFDDYTKTLEGNYWILSKNGITNRETAEASIAYNDGLKDGTIKVTSEETGDFMTDYMLDAMKGINTLNPDVPLTKAQSFSIIAGVLISGVAMKGRSIKYPKIGVSKIKSDLVIREGKYEKAARKAGMQVLNNGKTLDDMAKTYADTVRKNQKWSWQKSIPDGDKLSIKEKKLIKDTAVSQALLPKVEVKKVEGMKFGFADFKSAGAVKETVELPKAFWKKTDAEQFKWLDEQVGGKQSGMTWHHTETPGKMELVETGIHDIVPHNGGRTSGMWADAPR
ncbi:hypothetical protein HB825_14215 [Listeria booriae]|uniref:T7SS effector LXG polymorphic toxin n=1 Tax=Listeria booriae TaxID=1552123 RepID=UPI001624CC29|nr:T7SS effector LXG polymorphic toxin [Listeria booriae]MBC1504240.1 hypothetical protein [Listeria booriae]MBC6135994.1 hypothetical protein [Listeria booriae]